MRSLFDQTVLLRRSGFGGDEGGAPAQAGTVAAADSATIANFARAGLNVAFLIYTPSDPQAAVGDALNVGGVSYTVVALARPYVNHQIGVSVFVTPCGSIAS